MVPSRVEAHRQLREKTNVHSRTTWLVTGGSVVLMAAAGLVLAIPRASISPSRAGLAQVSWQSLFGTVNSASFYAANASISLADQRGTLSPVRVVPSDVAGVVRARIVGPAFLSWIPWNRRVLTLREITPTPPRLVHAQAARSLSGSVRISFVRPVAKVIYTFHGQSHTLTLPNPERTLLLPLPATHPGSHGSLQVAASARTWEGFGPTETVRWATPPYLAALPSTTAAIQPTASLTVHFSAPLIHSDLSKWQVLPSTPGRWTEVNASTYRFTPSDPNGFGPGALVAVDIPGGQAGPMAANGSYLSSATKVEWTTPPGSVLRLQQLLAQEGYLPVRWNPAQPTANTLQAQDQTIYQPPKGTFQWKYPHLPQVLRTLWTPGQMSVMTKGAIMQFERVNGLKVDGIAGPEVWAALIRDRIQGKVSPDGYTYISVTEDQPETLELWVNGKLKLKTLANTGIPATPTYLGTYAIFERLPFQIMRGKNPNGVPYADPVYWINYFAGSDAVHGFYRASYGFPQSLGCVELPLAIAPVVYHAVHYGTLVTVNPVGVAPAPSGVAAAKKAGAPPVSPAPPKGRR